MIEDPQDAEPDGPAPHGSSMRMPRWVLASVGILGLTGLVVLALLFSQVGRPASPILVPRHASTSTPPTSTALSARVAASTPASAMPRSWILRPTLPATATQADGGAQVYRLVCSTCHGYGGEGLDYGLWAKTASPAENCWQTKCHGGGHPVDGFALPRHLPRVVGPGALKNFPDALALYEYIRATMPYQVPGTMLDEEYWEVTAFLVRANGFDPILTPLDPQRAAAVSFR